MHLMQFSRIDLAETEGNQAAAQNTLINCERLPKCKKTTNASQRQDAGDPNFNNENIIKDWVNAQRADRQGLSTVQIQLRSKSHRLHFANHSLLPT